MMRRWNSPQLQRTRDNLNHDASSTSERRRPTKLLTTLGIRYYKAIAYIFVITIFIFKITVQSRSAITSSQAAVQLSSVAGNALLFTCPVGLKSIAANDNEAKGLVADFYNETNGARNSKMDSTAEELTNTTYDGWSHTFEENKKISYDWKVEHFSTLQSGDVIYESACGECFNLAMTLQIMKDAGKIDNISVYGNDYIAKSVEVGHHVLEKLAPPGTKIGSLCQGDSTDLHFVPSDSFDLAYTGYIDQLVDPYDIFESNLDGYSKRDMCKAKNEKGDWAKAKLVDIDQAAQEDWYAKWVSELVRIVKPGKYVLIENVGMPQCDNLGDWGGVSKEWWKLAVSKYKWNVDVDSILTKDITKNNRYNVSMRKNKKTS